MNINKIRKFLKRKCRMRRHEKRAFLAMTLIVSAVGITVLVRGNALGQEISRNTQKEETLEQQLQDETERTQDIRDLENYMQTDEYIEKIAREKLGLLKENEILFREN